MIEKDNAAKKPRSEMETKLGEIENGILKQIKERLTALSGFIAVKKTALNNAKQLYNEKKEPAAEITEPAEISPAAFH